MVLERMVGSGTVRIRLVEVVGRIDLAIAVYGVGEI